MYINSSSSLLKISHFKFRPTNNYQIIVNFLTWSKIQWSLNITLVYFDKTNILEPLDSNLLSATEQEFQMHRPYGKQKQQPKTPNTATPR